MKAELLALLEPFGQEHLLTFWNELDDSGRVLLEKSIRSLDFSLIERLYLERDKVISIPGLERACDPPAYRLRGEEASGGGTLTAPVEITPEAAVAAGKEALTQGKLAVVIVAGGQGTRLGFSAPKGMYPVGPVAQTTLFQIHTEKVAALSRKYGRPVPLCIMTSPSTHADTVGFFEKMDYFGYPKKNIHIFCQGTMPAVGMENGRVLLAAKGEIAISPNGHGGMLAAIDAKREEYDDRSILSCLDEQGISDLFYFQVDNALVDICSEEMIGYHLLGKSELTSQVIRKRNPDERVGNVIRIDDRLCIIEYSDISDELANKLNPDGSLNIWAGSIAVHIMDLKFLKRMAAESNSLPFHIARKKVPYISTQPGDNFGLTVKPESPNAIKFERFIFDLMPAAANSVVVEVDIPHNYAPLKNAPGSPSDSPETVRKQLSEFHAERLKKVGAIVPENVTIEISPLYANEVEELAAKIAPGTTVEPNCENGILLR